MLIIFNYNLIRLNVKLRNLIMLSYYEYCYDVNNFNNATDSVRTRGAWSVERSIHFS